MKFHPKPTLIKVNMIDSLKEYLKNLTNIKVTNNPDPEETEPFTTPTKKRSVLPKKNSNLEILFTSVNL